jgi:inorganic triphosphatase YgiF
MSGPREFELKLEFEPEKAESLKRHPAVARLGSDAHTETLTSVYFDTDDQRLFGAGVFLRVRRVGDRHIQTIKTVTPGHLFSRGEWEQEIEGPSPDLGQAKDTALGSLSDRDLGKKLKPVFETRVERRISRLQKNGSDIEVALDQGIIDTGDRKTPVSELELEIKNGDPGELFRLARELSESVPLQLAVKSKSERGYALLEGSDGNLIEKAVDLEISPTMTLDHAFKVIGRSCLRQLLANRPAMLARKPEALHQMRIGLRRLRTAISIFKDVVADSKRDHIKGELEWITGELGPARDLDVLSDEVVRSLGDVVLDRDLSDTRKEIEDRRQESYSHATRSIKSTRFAQAVLETAEWIEVGTWTSTADPLMRLRRERPIALHAAAELARRRKKIRKQGKHLRDLSEERRHKLRIRAKKLRYATEFFASVFTGEKNERRREAALSSLKTLQSALGDLNDIVAREKLMSEMADATAKGSERPSRVPFVAGVIYGSQEARTEDLLKTAERAHAEFSDVKSFWKA